jgi:drug/metabolite transporter (DMT)-like permease
MKHNLILFKTKCALVITIILWASAFVGIRAGLETYSAGGVAILRLIVASICMFFIYKRYAKRDNIPMKDKIQLLLIGAIGIGLYNITLNVGEVSIPSGTASFIISQSPVIAMLFAVIFLGEVLSLLAIIGITISIFGVFLISSGQANGFHFNNALASLLFATTVGALYHIFQKPLLKKYHTIDVTAYVVWGGTLMMSIYIPDLIKDISNASTTSTLSAIYLGIFPGSIAYLTWNHVLAEIPASRAVSFLYYMPIVATLLGWLLLNEVPTLISLLGGLVALFGVWVVNHSYVRKQSASA